MIEHSEKNLINISIFYFSVELRSRRKGVKICPPIEPLLLGGQVISGARPNAQALLRAKIVLLGRLQNLGAISSLKCEIHFNISRKIIQIGRWHFGS